MKTEKLKKIVLCVAALGMFNSTAMAQKEKKYKEISLTKTSDVINVPADSLWEIVGPGFHKVGIWIRTIDHTEGLGDPEFEGAQCSERICDVATRGYDQLREKLILYKVENKELAYKVMDGLPGFVLYAQNHWTVTAAGPNSSVLEMDINMRVTRFMGTVLGGMMKKQFAKALETTFEDLKIYAETGELSEAKKARIAKLEKKRKK